jgi:UDP-N-acetylmuramate dehydrogenase
LVSDKGIRGAVVDLGRISGVEANGEVVTALCGTPVSAVAEFAHSRGLAGMEFAYGLPGSIGGAVWMNARCYEREMSDALALTESFERPLPGDRKATPLITNKRPIERREWGYKRSPFQRNGELILRASFRLSPGDPRAIGEAMGEHRMDREAKGHYLFPCAGSVFKNNRDFGAPTGKLIDSLGLKGRRIGDAQIAPFHGNIIINTGQASAEEVLALIELAEQEVEKRLGFFLQREVLLVGDWSGRSSRPSTEGS